MKSSIMFFICFQVARSRELWGICNLPDERTQITFQFGCNVNYFDWWSFWREHLIWILICWAYYAVKGFLSLEQPAFNCSTFSCRNCPFWLMLLVWSNKYLGGGRWPLTTQVEQDKCGCEKSIFSFFWALKREKEGDHEEEREEEGRRGRDRGRVTTLPENKQVLLWRGNILWTMIWENAWTRENQRESVKHQALEPERRTQAEIRLLLGNLWKAAIKVKWKCDNLTPSPGTVQIKKVNIGYVWCISKTIYVAEDSFDLNFPNF